MPVTSAFEVGAPSVDDLIFFILYYVLYLAQLMLVDSIVGL